MAGVKAGKCSKRPALLGQLSPSVIREDPFNEIFTQARVVESSFLFNGQERQTPHEHGCEETPSLSRRRSI